MHRTLLIGLVWLLLVWYPADCKPDVLVEYSFADADSSTATNTGTLGDAADGVITGGSIIDSPLSPDGFGLLLAGVNGSGISMANAFNYDEEVTVEALVRLDALNGQNLNVIFDDFGGPGVLMGVDDKGLLRFTVSTKNGDATVFSDSALPLKTWHHVAGVYNGSHVRLAIDEIVVATVAATGAIVQNANVTPDVGVESGGSVFPWTGAIDDFRIHDVAITIGVLPGDVNLDCSVDLLDVAPFVELLESGNFQAEADVNQDGVVNLLDVAPFVDLLSGG